MFPELGSPAVYGHICFLNIDLLNLIQWDI